MAARDRIHEAVKAALIKDDWMIRDEPLVIRWDDAQLEIDLGAEKILLAEKEEELIAVEVKSFLRSNSIPELQKAVGQYLMYREALAANDPERRLFLATHQKAMTELMTQPQTEAFLSKYQIHLLIVDVQQDEIEQWIVQTSSAQF
jgi:hypothetical protein